MTRVSLSPAIVGVSQIVQRSGSVPLSDALGPIELMVSAARDAAEDAGAPGLLSKVQFVGVAGGWFRYQNPGQLVAAQIGAPMAATVLSSVSGTGPQDLLGLAAERIASGELDVALIVGGEARWSHQRLSRSGTQPHWLMEPGTGQPESVSAFAPEMVSELRMIGTTGAYALFEDSLRFAHGSTVSEHRDHIAALWADFSTIASRNPSAWDRTVHSADAIRNASPENRMIAFPYTKAMVANNTVDMATAVLLCSPAAASAAGVGRDRAVFPHVVTSSHETWQLMQRNQLHAAPALTTAGQAAFAHTGLGPDDFDHVDLYACFPSIVQISSAALGLRSDRDLSVTGGLGFAAAPIGNAVGHSIAAMVERVRGGGVGLIHGNGGTATKHSFAVYSGQPPTAFARIDVQESVEHDSRSILDPDWTGPVTIEAATVVYDREGPVNVLATVLNPAGSRGWARSVDPDLIALVESDGIAGLRGERLDGEELRLSS